ncbi:hypothetical protein Goarm_010270, partial [Gossypium armourianum]|nr:hypothetical protein [Gossypium armourianum]
EVITGSVVSADWNATCEQLLGKVPNKFRGSCTDMGWLNDNFKQIEAFTSDVEKEQFARTFILSSLGVRNLFCRHPKSSMNYTRSTYEGDSRKIGQHSKRSKSRCGNVGITVSHIYYRMWKGVGNIVERGQDEIIVQGGSTFAPTLHKDLIIVQHPGQYGPHEDEEEDNKESSPQLVRQNPRRTRCSPSCGTHLGCR